MRIPYRWAALCAALLLHGCAGPEGAPDNVMNAVENATDAAADNGAAPATAYCDIVRTDLPPADCELLRKQKQALVEGMGNLSAPGEMVRGETATVRFAVEPKEAAPTGESPEKSRAPASETSSPEGPQGSVTTQIPVQIGSAMTATLEGDGFDIAPKGEQVRKLGAANRAIWSWKVKAIKGGAQALYLTVTTNAIGRDGKPTSLNLFDSYAEVTVNVTFWDRAKDLLGNFTALFNSTQGTIVALTAVIVALGSLVAAWRALRRKAKPAGRGDPGAAA